MTHMHSGDVVAANSRSSCRPVLTLTIFGHHAVLGDPRHTCAGRHVALLACAARPANSGEVIRNTPILVQLLWTITLPIVFGIEINAFSLDHRLSIYSSAFIAEVYRAGYPVVPKGIASAQCRSRRSMLRADRDATAIRTIMPRWPRTSCSSSNIHRSPRSSSAKWTRGDEFPRHVSSARDILVRRPGLSGHLLALHRPSLIGNAACAPDNPDAVAPSIARIHTAQRLIAAVPQPAGIPPRWRGRGDILARHDTRIAGRPLCPGHGIVIWWRSVSLVGRGRRIILNAHLDTYP